MRFQSRCLNGVISAVLLLTGQSVACANLLSSEQILRMMKKQDPVSVVNKLLTDQAGENWQNILAQIKTGDPDWLRLPQLLEKGTSTIAAEQLMDAVTRAIPENPSGILHILNEQNIFLNSINICSLPLISADHSDDEAFKVDALGAIKAQPDGGKCAKIMQEAISGDHSVPGTDR